MTDPVRRYPETQNLVLISRAKRSFVVGVLQISPSVKLADCMFLHQAEYMVSWGSERVAFFMKRWRRGQTFSPSRLFSLLPRALDLETRSVRGPVDWQAHSWSSATGRYLFWFAVVVCVSNGILLLKYHALRVRCNDVQSKEMQCRSCESCHVLYSEPHTCVSLLCVDVSVRHQKCVKYFRQNAGIHWTSGNNSLHFSK